MESIVVGLILPLIEELLPLFNAGAATTSTITAIIKALEAVIPILSTLALNIVPKIKNIIAVISASPEATAEQLVALRQLDANSDAAFDAALANAEAEDSQT